MAFDDCGYFHLTAEADDNGDDPEEEPFASDLFESAQAMFSDYGFLPPLLRGLDVTVVVGTAADVTAGTCYSAATTLYAVGSVATLAFALLQ